MTTLTELNKVVRDSINAAITIDNVIVANQNGNRPANDFATVYTGEMTPIGMRDVEYSTNAEDLDEKVVRMFEARMSINFFRENARLNAALYASSLAANSLVDLFNVAKVGVIRFSPIRDLTQVFNSTQEERAQLDLFLHFELTAPVEPVTGIDSVRIIGQIENGEEIVKNVNITVP